MKHSWIIILVIIIVAAIFLGIFSTPPGTNSPAPASDLPSISVSQTQNHYQASFVIFTNGTKRIFTDPKYHNVSSDVFLKLPNPEIIHVKKSNITYQDFFNTLPMKIDKKCLITGTEQTFCSGNTKKLRFFINEIENPNTLDEVIQPNDKLLITFGNLTDAQIESQLSQIPNP